MLLLLHNEELLTSNIRSVTILKEGAMSEACSTQGSDKNAYKILGGKTEGNRALGRRRRRWDDDINIYFKQMGLEDVDWVHLAQYMDPVVGFCKHCNESSDSMKCG
jgi:hypothetical protein